MSFLKRWGKKRNEDSYVSASNKPISKPDITLIPNSCDPKLQPVSLPTGPQQGTEQTWPLAEQVDTGPTKFYWDEQRPLTMILESPEIPSCTSTPQVRHHPSPRMDFPNMGGLLIENQNGRKAPLRASPIITQHPAHRDPPTKTHPALRESPALVQHPGQRQSPVVQQITQQPALQESPILKQEPTQHRFRLPKIPPPDADDWTPLTDRFGSKSPQEPKPKPIQLPKTQRPRQLPSPPPTASTTHTNMTGFASTTATASSPNWVSFSYPKPQQNYSRPNREIVSSSRTLLASPEITPTPTPKANQRAKRPVRTPEASKLFARVEGMEDPFKPNVHQRRPSTPPRAPETPPRQTQRARQQEYQRPAQPLMARKPSNPKPKVLSPKRHPANHVRKISGHMREQPSPRRRVTAPVETSQPMRNAPRRVRDFSSPARKPASPVKRLASPARRPPSRLYVQQSPRGRIRHSRQGSSLSRHSRSRSSMISLSDTASVNSRRVRGKHRGNKRGPAATNRKKLKALDAQIAAIATRLNELDAMSKLIHKVALPVVPENESEEEQSDRNDSVVDDDSKTVSSASEGEWETIEDVSVCSRSTRPKRRSRSYAHSRGPSMAQSSGMLTYGTSVYDATEAADSVSALPTTIRASPTKKRSSLLETGLATTMSYSRTAPAVVQMRTASPRKTPRAQRLSRLGHRPQPSGYSFITFKSMGSVNNLGSYDYLDDKHYDSLLADTNDNCDDDEFEDVLEEVDGSYDSDQRPSTAATHQSNFSLFPNQHGGPKIASNTTLGRYQYWSPGDLDRLALTPRKSDVMRSPVRRMPNGHARSGSRTLDESVKLAGNTKYMVGDVKRWISRVPKRVSYGKKTRDDRSNCFSIGKAC